MMEAGIKNFPILLEVDKILSGEELQLEHKDTILRRCFSESWFSDTLAWLLDPKGSHKLGVKFSQEFLRTIAIARSANDDSHNRGSMLKHGKANTGVTVSTFDLKNASSIREFYLSKSITKRQSRAPKYCDVVFLDLDVSDGLIVIIENKLFTSNHRNQLEEYYELVEEKFKRAKVREYVYLTIDGKPPLDRGSKDSKLFKYWVNLSWSENVLEILNKLKKDNEGDEHSEVIQLRKVLYWLGKIKNKFTKKTVDNLRDLLVEASRECLLEELNRLGEGKSGNWYQEKKLLYHSSSTKKPLYVELLPNLTITVQSRRKVQAVFEKIIVPFGIQPDQIFNLIDIAARDIFHNHFENNIQLYLSGNRRLSTTIMPKKEEYRAVFEYAYRHKNVLKIILSSSKLVWSAQEQDDIASEDEQFDIN